jgi:YD repeat-containing protein
LVTKTYADASTYTYTYDAAGRLLTRTDAKAVTTAYAYDALGRLLTVDYPNDPDIVYTYDLLGRRLTMTDAAGTATWTYDPLTGQPASADGPFDNDTLAFTWDAAGRRLSTALDGTAVATHTYDTLVSRNRGQPSTSSFTLPSCLVRARGQPSTSSLTLMAYDAFGRK